MPDLHDFEVVATTDGGVTTVSPRGELDMETAAALREAIVTSFAGARYVVVDLAQVPFLDSSGLAVFGVAHKRAAECGARFEIANPSDQARELLKLTGVDQLVPIRDEHEELPLQP